MSRTRQVLELNSPGTRDREERLTGLVQQCNYCCGNGWFWERAGEYDSEKVACPICQGSGKVQPTIVITWSPSRGEK